MHLYIVRHGNTFGNNELPRRIGSKTNIPLVESGLIQAVSLGKYFSDKNIIFSKVYSSPLIRAKQTAQKILQQFSNNLVIEELDFLNEIDHGPDENKIESEVIERIGRNAIKEWDKNAIEPEGWIVDADKRIEGWRKFIELQNVCDRILLVTSNGAARFLLKAYQINHVRKNLKLKTGAFGCIEFEDGKITLKYWDFRPD